MKKLLLALFSTIMMVTLTGCGADSKPKSMAEGLELSEIEAYEQANAAMEAEDEGGMEINEKTPEQPAEKPAE